MHRAWLALIACIDWLIDLFCGPDAEDCADPLEHGDGEDSERFWPFKHGNDG